MQTTFVVIGALRVKLFNPYAITVSCPENVLFFYVCCIYPSAPQTIFFNESKQYESLSDWEQSDLGPYCLQYMLPKNISRPEEKRTKVVTGSLWVNIRHAKPGCILLWRNSDFYKKKNLFALPPKTYTIHSTAI